MAATRAVVGTAKRAHPFVVGGLSTDWVTGKPHQFSYIKDGREFGDVQKKTRVFLYREEEYCKVGLLYHDLLADDEYKIARLAKERMTQEQKDALYFRINRALLLSAAKKNLPKDEWTPIDAEHLYMQEIIKRVEHEEFEKKLTKAALNDYDDNWERLLLIPFRLRHYFKIKETRQNYAERFSASVV
ncbi:cytochrome b-c1 complex subunit 7-like [Styela clava]|uniref:cytochrome b-c1 complex subunit 7-like n=1 Tax=Styela clava TaxID=7725 RepID=UPI00193A1FF0|nr:cytochrome b-c1 complex subunit 7-like [Styela clava]